VDGRSQTAALSAQAETERSAGLERLRQRVPGVAIEFDPRSASPKGIASMSGFLTGPQGEDGAVSRATVAGIAAGDPYRPIKGFLLAHRALFGYGPEALDSAQARVARDYVTAHNGLRTIVWEQQVDGIRIYDAAFIANLTSRAELVNISSQFVPTPELAAAGQGNPNRTAWLKQPPLSARQAIVVAAESVGVVLTETALSETATTEPGPEQRHRFHGLGLKGEAEAKLMWLALERAQLRLCWDVLLMSRARGEMFRSLVDASTGELLRRECLTRSLSDASYRVWTRDSPSPLLPGHSSPVTNQPPVVARTLVTLSALDTNASPAGWINDADNQTLGNNVDAHTDVNNDNVPDLPRPQGSPFRVFDSPIDLTADPTTYSNASVVQLFYLCNWYHDTLYGLGFTEAADNFQTVNFGRGGLGNDAVQADAQDGGGFNNANFSTPPDGSPGRMQMYLWNGPTPYRDGALDASLVLHESTHGLSWRLVGGGQALGTPQSDGMGEGWSDFYALSLLSQSGDDPNGNYPATAYAGYNLGVASFAQNYYFGVRRYPYTTDMSKNPLTFKDIDPAQADYCSSGAPYTTRLTCGTGDASEVHNQGEVWCVTLWEARVNLIRKYGWAVGNQLILQLVTDAMKLTPAHPNFLQARDAILQADLVDNARANRHELWAAFGKRGMGYSATSPASSTTTGVKEAFDVPDDLQLTPSAGLSSLGPVGGPFNPACQTFSLSNSGPDSLSWVAYSTQAWVSAVPASGSLASGATGAVSVCIGPAAGSLSPGFYSATVVFSNASSGLVQARTNSLFVAPARALFFSLDTDPHWTRAGQWAFGQPTGAGGASRGNPDPSAGATGSNVFGINLNGDYSTAVGGPQYLITGPLDLSAYTGMALQFKRWLNCHFPPFAIETLEVSSNLSTWSMGWTNPAGSPITDSAWTSVAYDISAVADARSSVYLRWGHKVGGGGGPAYSGWNLDDIELLGTPTRRLTVTVPASTTEGDGLLAGAGQIGIYAPLPTNLVVSLASSDTTEATVPSSVTIPAGQTNVAFDVTIVDDTLLDGTQTATITATAPGFAIGKATIAVLDNESINDLILSATSAPGILAVGTVWTNTLLLTNTGPAGATGVLITNVFPPSANFLAASAGLGTYTVANNTIVFDVGALPGSGSAVFSIAVVPTVTGPITNSALVIRAEPDGYPSNNVATTTAQVVSAAPLFNRIWLGSAGEAHLDISGLPGDVYSVLASTNLVSWQFLATLTNSTGTTTFVDPSAPSDSARFYRLNLR
jgi:uncharacterized repeat protein (TIGR01451 family)